MECKLCRQEIDVQYAPTGEVAWAEGHNAAPLAEGQCCTNCNETRVFPARLTELNKKHGLPKGLGQNLLTRAFQQRDGGKSQ